jgi:hypothetical protein
MSHNRSLCLNIRHLFTFLHGCGSWFVNVGRIIFVWKPTCAELQSPHF